MQVLALLAAALSLGCKVFAPTLSAPERWGFVWREAVTEHVVVATDVDEEKARAVAVVAETRIQALRRVAFRGIALPPRWLRIVCFSRSEDFRRAGPAMAEGVFEAGLPNDIEDEPTVLLRCRDTEAPLTHEIVHALVARAIPFAPRWLHEGLATYYETMELRDGAVHVGGPVGMGSLARLLASASGAPDVRDLVGRQAEEFYPTGFSFPFVNEARTFANYRGSWALAGVLLETPEYRDHVDRLFWHGPAEPGKRIYDTIFAGLDPVKLEAEYRAYLDADHPRRAIPHRPAREVRASVREMPPAEVRILWARLFPWERKHLERVHGYLDEALALAPRSAGAWFWRGWLSKSEGDLTAAARSIDVALALEPEQPMFLLGAVLVADALEEAGRLDDAGRGRRELRLSLLEKTARGAQALVRVAAHQRSAGKGGVALQTAWRAIDATPDCFTCYFALARAAVAAGKPGTAAFAIERLTTYIGDIEELDLLSHERYYLELRRRSLPPGRWDARERRRQRFLHRYRRERPRWLHDGRHPLLPADGAPVPHGFDELPPPADPAP